MEEAPENGKESSHSAHANGMNQSNGISLCLALLYTHRNNTEHNFLLKHDSYSP
jgi:hypothetical protein